MSQIERLREELHKVIETGDTARILRISQELDTLILCYMKLQKDSGKKSA
jgi:tRNA nucleotidyltransferase/poly(A) polymerase